MYHGPGSLKRMNPDAALGKETDNNNVEIKPENNRDIPEVKVVVKDSLEVSEETRKKKT